jgi:N,N'-diacetylbacillosaminyl-diphospho-undecaprenol alpha-1,3-N-acetylgalactosaminyltransferase
MRKIAIICNTDGAVYNFRKPLIELHIKDGWEVQSFSNDYGNYFAELRKLKCIPNRINFQKKNNIFSNLSCIFSTLSLIRKYNPDVIHIYTLQPIILLSIPLRIFGFKLIFSTVTGMGMNFDIDNGPLSMKQKIILFMLKLSFKANQKVQVQNYFDYDFLLKNKVVKSDKIVKINGSGMNIETRGKEITKVDRDFSVLKKFNLNPEKKIVLFASRGLKEKGLIQFAEAAKIISDLYPEFQFVHAGGYPEFLTKMEYESFARSNNFMVLGYIKEISSVFKISDVIILPSLYREGTPKSLIEGIYHNKIIITNDIPGCNETVINGANGWLCKPGNTYDMIANILKVDKMDMDLVRRTNDFLILKYDVQMIYNLNKTMYNLNY